jgi:hypothetical protein
MKSLKNKISPKGHTAVFRITEEQHQEFAELLATMPGSNAGAMYREIFTRGLKDMKTFSEKHSLFTREEAAAELIEDEEVEHDSSK